MKVTSPGFEFLGTAVYTLARVAGVKRGRGRGSGKREFGRAREKVKERVPLLPPPSRVVSRPNSLSLPFRTPATQVRVTHQNLQVKNAMPMRKICLLA